MIGLFYNKNRSCNSCNDSRQLDVRLIYDSLFGKSAGEKGTNVLGHFGEIWKFLITARWKTIIFWKIRLSSFQKYIVFFTYHQSIHLAVIRNSSFFPVHSKDQNFVPNSRRARVRFGLWILKVKGPT